MNGSISISKEDVLFALEKYLNDHVFKVSVCTSDFSFIPINSNSYPHGVKINYSSGSAPHAWKGKVTDLLENGQKIEAIKMCRNALGIRLKNAKYIVDDMQSELNL